jgi:hypothetical protein
MNRILPLIFIFLLCFSCDKTTKNIGEAVRPNDPGTVARLFENKTLHGEIISVAFIDKDNFAVSTRKPSSVITYDASGQQTLVIANVGSGPYEFREPSIVRADNEHIYVWCSDQLKLIVYTHDGEPLDEFTGFKKAIRDFVPIGNKIAFYTTGGSVDTYIEIFDLDQKSVEYKGGDVTNEQLVLSLQACSGGLSNVGDKLLFMSPDRLEINVIDLNVAEALETIKLEDPDFKVRPVAGEAKEFINNEREKAFLYLFENSQVNGIYALGEKVLVKAEVGKWEVDFDDKFFDDSERFNKFFILDSDLELSSSFVMERNGFENSCLYFSNGEFLHALVAKEEDNDYYYELIRYDLE